MRYRSYEALRRFLTTNRLFVVKGESTTNLDVMEYNAEVLVNAAFQIITTGQKRWTI